MRNLRWVLNTLAKFRLDMITLTVSKDRICLLVRKKKKLFRAFLRLKEMPNIVAMVTLFWRKI